MSSATSSSEHSRIIGYAFDGYPIYGPYSYANADGTGPVIGTTDLMEHAGINYALTLPVSGVICFAAGFLFGQAVQPPKTHLKEGDTAPDFTLNSTAGGKVTLSDFRGKFNVVLAFFPAAFTGG